MAREISEEILRSMKLQDGPSPVALVAFYPHVSMGMDPRLEFFRVSAPVEGGQVLYRVEIFADTRGGTQYWPAFACAYGDIDGALALIDGILRKQMVLRTLELLPVEDGARGALSIASWEMPRQTRIGARKNPDSVEAIRGVSSVAALRLEIFRGAMKALLTK